MAILIFGVDTLGFDSLGPPHAAVREGQVERNLNCLDGNERQLDEETPVGLTIAPKPAADKRGCCKAQRRRYRGGVLDRTGTQKRAGARVAFYNCCHSKTYRKTTFIKILQILKER